MSPRGYTGAAEAYIGLSDEEKAIEILKRGLEQLSDNNDIEQMLNRLITPEWDVDILNLR